jgi:hypothetical protein
VLERFVIASRSRTGRVALLSAFAAAGCADAKCIVTTTQFTTSVTTVGYVGPTLGQPVARFDLTQDFVSHEPYAACAQGPLQDVGAVRLSVTSTATAPLALDFEVQGLNADSIPVWSQPGTIQRIMPGETVEVGQISVSPTHVDHGAKVILKSVAILP